MYQSDYILRMIEQLTSMLRRLLDSLREAKPEEALELADEAVGFIAETTPALIDALTPEGLVEFLSAGGELDVERAVVLSVVLERRADALAATGAEDAASSERVKAAALMDAALAFDEVRARDAAEALSASLTDTTES